MTRNFFGIKSVTIIPKTSVRTLYHGSTNHGAQDFAPQRRQIPLTYFHREGPAGDIFALPVAQHEAFKVGIIGLGVGSLVTYARPGNEFTFYEIDPDIIDMVSGENPIFSFVYEQASQTRIISGDGRLKLQEAPVNYYDMIVLDAFSSDAIPMHLITNEALQIYLTRLQPEGVLALHISNRYLDLLPVLKNMAEKNSLKALFTQDHTFNAAEPANYLRERCTYVVMARSDAPIATLKAVKNKTWQELPADLPEVPLWTDSFSSIIPILK
jgi:spermidine synthase